MQATFQTKIQDEGVYPLLDAIAALFGRLMRRLFVDLYVRGRKVSECKRLYIARYGVTARFFNALAYELKGKVKAAEEARKHRMGMLRDQIAASEKVIRRLQKQDRALASGKGKAADLQPHERAEHRRRVRFRYKAELAGITVRADVDERNTSRTCLTCGRVREASRISRGLYRCPCGWTAQADVNGALNIYERAFQVSPIKGSSGRVARPVVVSFQPGWHTVHEPKRRIACAHPLADAP